jgi:hypothetical protein
MRGVSEAFIKRAAAQVDGAAFGDAVFSDGGAIWAGKREVAHAHGDGVIEIRLTKAEVRARREELRADARVVLRKNASDWIEFAIGSRRDEADALALIRVAVAANLLTAKPGLPPSGADLARRKRFH